jgi:hypothetical protein
MMIDHIESLVRKTGVKNILDYGAGSSGILARDLPQRIPGINIIGYEPGVPELSRPPDPSPFVLCIDVLEHVEPEYVDAVLDDLKRVTICHGFFNVATEPAQRILPDGRNAHLTVQPIEWWTEKITSRWDHVKRGKRGEFYINID